MGTEKRETTVATHRPFQTAYSCGIRGIHPMQYPVVEKVVQIAHMNRVSVSGQPTDSTQVRSVKTIMTRATTLTPPPLEISPHSARRSPPRGGGDGDGRQVTVSPLGDCKGISRQSVVPSTDASKQNTSKATFALMLCQRDSCNTDVIGGPKEG